MILSKIVFHGKCLRASDGSETPSLPLKNQTGLRMKTRTDDRLFFDSPELVGKSRSVDWLRRRRLERRGTSSDVLLVLQLLQAVVHLGSPGWIGYWAWTGWPNGVAQNAHTGYTLMWVGTW